MGYFNFVFETDNGFRIILTVVIEASCLTDNFQCPGMLQFSDYYKYLRKANQGVLGASLFA